MKCTELLKQDHEKVKELFEQIEGAKGIAAKRPIFEQIKTELDVHARIEEALLYPVFQNKEGFEDMIDEALDEHQEVKDLLVEIANTTSENSFDNKVGELIEGVEHHVEEEETELFPKIEQALENGALETIGVKMEEMKSRLLSGQKAA